MASRNGRPGASSESWPTISSMVARAHAIGERHVAAARARPSSDAVGSAAGRTASAHSLATPDSRLPTPDFASLPRDLEEHEAGGDADVERFDRGLHRDADAQIRHGHHVVGQARCLRLRRTRRAARRDRPDRGRRRRRRRARRGAAHARGACAGRPRASAMRATGRRSELPIAPRNAFHPNGWAVPPVATKPVAPAASLLRISVPTLPGSWMPTATVRSARDVTANCDTSRMASVARARMPTGVRVGLAASSTAGVTRWTSRPCRSARVTIAAMSGRASAPSAMTIDRQRDTGVDGIGHQVWPVEEHVVGVAVGGVATPCDERMAAAGDDGLGHGGRGRPRKPLW